MTAIGQRGSPQAGLYAQGRIAEVAVWNAALDTAEIAALNNGFSPLCIRRESLKGYWPLIGRYSPEIDPVAGNGMTVTGASVADHCRVIYPSWAMGWQAPAAGASYSETGLLAATILAQLTRTDTWSAVDTGKLAATVLAQIGVTDTLSAVETGRLAATILAQMAGIDARAGIETGILAATILAQFGETDLRTFLETGILAATIHAQLGRTDVLALSETGRQGALLAAVLGVTHTAAFSEAGRQAAIILASMTGSDARAGFETGRLAATILAQFGESDAFTPASVPVRVRANRMVAAVRAAVGAPTVRAQRAATAVKVMRD